MSSKDIARNAYLSCQDSWMNARYFCRDHLYNGPSRRTFLSEATVLNDVQRRVVQDLSSRGIAIVHFDDLFGDRRQWEELREAYQSFADSKRVNEEIENYQRGARIGNWNKSYLIRQFPERTRIAGNSPWLKLGLDPRLLDVVNSYLGLWSKLYYFDLWYTLPMTGEETTASQNWHRDPEDRRLVKIFLYFSDVNEGSGPLQYIPGSRRSGGPYSHLWSKRHQAYPPQAALQAEIPSSEWVVGYGTPGTFILVDTTGFHRGGFATKQARLSATWTFVTPASYLARRLDVESPLEKDQLSGPARFAIT